MPTKKKPYVEQAIGTDVYSHVKFVDDALSRALLTSQPLAGTGDGAIPFLEGTVGGPVAVNVGIVLVPKAANEAGELKCDPTVDLVSRTIKVSATAGVQWKGTALYQRGELDQ
ncbi:MAG: hypothetical protein U1A78_39890 [Polyangia bacterium]